MRILSRTGLWTLCVCALVTQGPLPTSAPSQAHAQSTAKPSPPNATGKGKRAGRSQSVRQCMKFSQSLGDDEASVDLKLKSQCKFEVACSLEWELRCTGDDGTKTSEPDKRSTTLDFSDRWSIKASADTCEGDWEVADVRWNCVAAAE